MGGVKESFSRNFLLFRIDVVTLGKAAPSTVGAELGNASQLAWVWPESPGGHLQEIAGCEERGPDSLLLPQPGL